MKTVISVVVTGLLFCGFAFANEVDMEKTMKQMALNFKQAKEAQSLEQMALALAGFETQLQQAQQGKFQADKAQLYQQGLKELAVEVDQAQLFVEQQDLQGAKQHLLKMDELRKKYHKHRKPSFWQLIFG
ncbi:MAG: cytochrome b562 family protein [Gammaproteobacteria bacterium]|nr:cytochrome b562 family protein [Gammaproteobacteria bacterium]MBU2058821.1 cytochrome b562 family protein [Gammaproteobacteria bacterium]MBU2177116.1 cytochrome b562 family protein [Gammaproteobacteria bacterium]MBU2247102.1 cytochrome b562 family protein [Gammaproteobacteria bacterium]MBU2343594.1 cytochrome b562 family protein [Gammaproteobacteria bacterium]